MPIPQMNGVKCGFEMVRSGLAQEALTGTGQTLSSAPRPLTIRIRAAGCLQMTRAARQRGYSMHGPPLYLILNLFLPEQAGMRTGTSRWPNDQNRSESDISTILDGGV